MTDSLVAANIRQRPVRTLVSIIGVALGVVLVVLVVGLSQGIMKEQGRRNSNVGAEIVFSRPSSFGPASSSALSLPKQYADRIGTIEGVKAVSPVGQFLKSASQSFGMELVEGIDYDSYVRVAGIRIREGAPVAADDEVMVDPVYVRNKKVKIGDQVEIFGRKFRISGVYEPEIGSRLKIRLSVMQKLLGNEALDRCSFIYVKCQNGEAQDTVAKNIVTALPGNKVLFTRDIQALFEKGFPFLNNFLTTVVGVAMVVSTLVIMLAMYTTITERTREIGILKSMGASKRFIIGTIQKEALLISALGVVLGYAAAFTGKYFIMRYTTLLIEVEPKWLLYAAGFGLLSGLLGALYPALRAAKQDPIKALSYE